MSEPRYKAKPYDPAFPNESFVEFPSGYIEIGGSRYERERLAELIAKLLNEHDKL